MKKAKGITTRIAAMLLSGMMVIGAVPTVAFGSEIEVNPDPGQTTDVVVEDSGENRIEGYMIEQDSDAASQEEEAVTSYTVTLDANGGYFSNEWDDALNETLETAKTVTKLIPIGGAVATFPVLEQENATVTFLGWSLEPNGELVSQGYEEYIPVDNCALYAVWDVDEAVINSEISSAETSLGESVVIGDQEIYVEKNTDQTDVPQDLVDTESEENGDTEDIQEVEDSLIVDDSNEGNVEEDTDSNTYTAPETEDDNGPSTQQTFVSRKEEIFADEDAENAIEDAHDAVTEEETQPTLIEDSAVEETVREDAAMGVVMESGSCGNGLFWKIETDGVLTDGVLTISGSGKMTDFELYEMVDPKSKVTYLSNTRPWHEYTQSTSAPILINEVIIEEGVTNIGDYAFQNPCGVNKVNIPSSVKRIGYNAFNYCYLSNVDIPLGVEIIDDGAFSYCRSLENVTIPSSIKRIGRMAFQFSKLTNVTIPNGVDTIDYGAFWCCKNLTEITIPVSVTYIGKNCFYGCPDSLIIYGESGSYAEQYAKENGITFKPLDSNQGKYKVFFDTNGGSNIHLDHYTVTNGAPYGTSVAWTPSRDGHIFTGWYTSKDGGTKITEDTVVNLSEDQTLYAHWKEGSYTVTFDPNGGTISQKTKKYTGPSQYGVFPDVVRDGYELIGWFDAIENGRWIDESDQIKYSDHTLYAYWLPSAITFDPNGGEFRRWTNNCIQYDGEHRRYSKDMPLPVREGYEFVGWYTDKNSGEKMSENDLTEPQRVKQTLYAHWEKFTGFHASRDGWPIGNIEEIFSNNPEDSVAPISAYFSVDRINPKLLAGALCHSAKANCFGLCLLAVAQYEGKIDIESYTNQSGESLIEFGYDAIVDSGYGQEYSIAGNDRLKTLIQRAQVSQFSHTIASTKVFKTRRDDFSDIIEYTQRSTANPLIVGMTLDSGKHGVVLETGREVVHNSDGTIGIYCYDPNNPQPNGLSSSWADYYFNPESQIVINQSSHCWCFESYNARERRLVRSEWHKITGNDLAFYDISNLNSNWFFTNDMNFFKRRSGYMTNLFRSTSNRIDIYKTKSIQSQTLPFKFIDELVPTDYERFGYICNNSYSDALDMIVLEKGDYVYQLSGESEMVTISDNYAGCVNTNGEAYLVIGDDGIAQIENIGSDKLTFTLDVNCADGDGVVTAEGTLDSGNKIAVAPDDTSDNGYVVVKTDADLDDIHTTISIKNEVVENDFHEESDNPEEILISGTYGDAVNWSLSNTGCLTIGGTGELSLSDQEDPDQEDQPWYEYKDEIDKVVIKNGITKIGDFFFCGYINLKNVSLSDTVASVGQHAFSNTPIDYLQIPCEEFTLDYWSFKDCTNLKCIYFKGLAKTDKDYDVAVPFQGCTNLTDVTVDSGIIGRSMFRRCPSIKNVKLGNNVTEIGEAAFCGCTGISSIDLPNALTIIGDDAFCDSGIEEIHFPESLTSIGKRSFRGTKLKEITFTDSFTTCPGAFLECNELSSIRFGKNMTSIEGGAFSECNNLTEIVIPDSIQSIGASAFYKCSKLSKVTFGKSLTNIGHEAFAGCKNLENVILTNYNSLDWEINTFDNDTFVFNYPIFGEDRFTIEQYGYQLSEESGNNGSGGITWKGYLAEDITGSLGDNITWTMGKDGVFSISGLGKMDDIDYLLCPWRSYKRFIKKIDIQSGITSVGDSTFCDCKNLMEIDIPDSIIEIGENAFRNCHNLKDIYIPNGVTNIGFGAFSNCSSLKKINLPDNLEIIDSCVFIDCSSLTDISIPECVTEICPDAFSRCFSLKTFSIPEKVTLIGPGAFTDCKGLESIIVYSPKLTIFTMAFVNCSSLKEVYFKSDAPVFSLESPKIDNLQTNEAFKNDSLTAYYPVGNSTWNKDILKNYGGSINWNPWYNEISKCTISIDSSDVVYNGDNQAPNYFVKDGQKDLVIDKDYTISFKDNKNAGTATMTIEGVGNYKGTITKTFRINPALITTASVTGLSAKVYTGKALTQEPTVKVGSSTLKINTDYTISYSNNTNPGIATVTITGIGNYTGKKEVTFTINAAGWIIENGEWYYYKNDGTRLTNGWAKDSKGWYWLDASGKITKSKWIKSGGSWYYLGSNGIMTTGWLKVDGKWYYMNSSGIMTTGWQQVGGKWYYMNSSGIMTTGWQQVGGKWYYMNSSGIMTTGWQQISGKWYYMNSSGIMTTGWQEVGGNWYYMNSSGVMTTGWQQIGGKWYYMNSSGIMTTGWQQIGGKWYYMKSSGIMTTGWQVISGKWYYFDASGVWVR